MEIGLLQARSSRAGKRSDSFQGSTLSAAPATALPDAGPAGDLECCGEALRPFWADDGRYLSVCMKCGGETTHKHMVRYNGSPWIGVDLDGTLAQELSDSMDPDRIGQPVEAMMQRVRRWVADGQTVKIFTARASVPRQIELVKQWLKKHDLPDLEVTNAKDFKMIELWDDRAVQVARNSGQPTSGQPMITQTSTRNSSDSKVTIIARRKPRGSFVSKLRMFFAL